MIGHWQFISQRVQAFHLQLASELLRAPSLASKTPTEMDRIRTSFEHACRRSISRIQLGNDPDLALGNSAERMFSGIVRLHKCSIHQELKEEFGPAVETLLIFVAVDSVSKHALQSFKGAFSARAEINRQASAADKPRRKFLPSAAAVAAAAAAAAATATATNLEAERLMAYQNHQQQRLRKELQHHHHHRHQSRPGVVRKAAAAQRAAVVGSKSRRATASPSKAKAAKAPRLCRTKSAGSSGHGSGGSSSGGSTPRGTGRYRGAGRGGGWNTARLPEEDRNGLLKLPWDGLDAVSEQVKLVTDARVQLIEERRLRPSYVPPLSPRDYQYSSGTGGDSTEEPGSPQGHDDSEEAEEDAEAAARRREKQPWFARNVVDHRSAWCGLRNAGARAGLRKVLQPRPWGDPLAPSGGGQEAANSQVLELISAATQAYLKRVLTELSVVAYQRRGGLSEELLQGLEERMEDPRSPGSALVLYEGLVPRFPRYESGGSSTTITTGTPAAAVATTTEDPREVLRREEGAHRRSCLEREAGWEARVAEVMAAADGVAANEFARRVGFKRGVGLSMPASAEWRRKKRMAEAAEARGRGGGGGGGSGGRYAMGGSGQQQQQQQEEGEDQMEIEECDESRLSVDGGGIDARPSVVGVRDEGVGERRKRQSTGNNMDDQSDDDGNRKSRSGSGEDEQARALVRDVRRRFHRFGGTTPAAPGGRIEINNADLTEHLRAVMPTCSRESWAILSGLKARLASQRRRAADAGR
ncbi:hypothetical protein Esi_0035_0126 [Ectocarpus siliculosus]|uniref:Uncharacterized protein n=1 Tax=Ectocarpus siliculosus TaxID=2880 RepID=D7FYX3_ECTSI|nr:hypothetical protein Esi_0035_0126 [Ectocarpus siliculosus]|eukprot:CBJ26615.1 hypothetical protein Esi_0035_0126 [Ectocarpus siliculosus]